MWLDHRGLATATADAAQHTAAGHAAGPATHDRAQKSGLSYARGGVAAPPARQLTPPPRPTWRQLRGAAAYPVLAESDGVAVVAFTEAQGGTSRIGVRRLAGGTGSR